MKKILLLLSIIAPFIMACNKDDDKMQSNDPYATTFLYMKQNVTYDYHIIYNGNGDFVSKAPDELSLIYVAMTRPAYKDITVKLEIDEAFIKDFNKKQGVEYKVLTDWEIEPIVIRKGEYKSTQPIKLKHKNHEVFKKERFYILAFKASIDDSKIRVSKKFKPLVLTYRSEELNFEVGKYNETRGEKLTDFTNWNIYKNFTEEAEPRSKMTYIRLLTDNSSYSPAISYNPGTEKEGFTLDIDMAKEQTLSTIAVESHAAYQYMPLYMSVAIMDGFGADAKIVKDLGTAFITEDKKEANWTSISVALNFLTPLKARYIRMKFSGTTLSQEDYWRGANVKELIFYTPNN